MKISTHALARKLLALPDMPVAVHRNLDIYSADATEFRIDGERRKLLFDGDKKEPDETKQEVFWLVGSPLI